MPRLELTWQPYSGGRKGGRWCKTVEGQRCYFGNAPCKSDRAAYLAALRKYRAAMDAATELEMAPPPQLEVQIGPVGTPASLENLHALLHLIRRAYPESLLGGIDTSFDGVPSAHRVGMAGAHFQLIDEVAGDPSATMLFVDAQVHQRRPSSCGAVRQEAFDVVVRSDDEDPAVSDVLVEGAFREEPELVAVPPPQLLDGWKVDLCCCDRRLEHTKETK